MFTRRSTSCRYASRLTGSFLLSEEAGLSLDDEDEELDELLEDAELLELELLLDDEDELELPDEGSFGREAGVSGLDEALLDEDELSDGRSGSGSPGMPLHPARSPQTSTAAATLFRI